MTRAIPIEDLKPIDDTAIQILRIISLKIGEGGEGFVSYDNIARSLNLKRKIVASAVERMKERGILACYKGKLSIPVAITVER